MPVAQCRDIQTAWYEVGRGDPVVLVHGLADDHRVWRKVLPALAMRHRAILYDLRGHGLSTLGAADGTLEQLSGDLVALLDHLEIEQADLCGYSLGGTIVMRTAIDQPGRVRRLVPVATSSRVGRGSVGWFAERAKLVAAGAPDLREVMERDARQTYSIRPEELADGWTIRSQSTSDPRGYGNACLAMARLHEHPLDPELGSIKAPTLVIAADGDAFCPPRGAEIIAAGIAGSRMALVEGAGHPVMVDRPQEVAALLLEFLQAGVP